MKNFRHSSPLFVLAFLFLSTAVMAQFPFGGAKGASGAQGGMAQAAKMNIGRVYGAIIDAKTKKPVEFASVALLHFSKDSAIAGQLSTGKGEFNMENLPFGSFRLRISFLGYKTFEKRVNVSPANMEQELGDLVLEQDDQVLKEVVVTEEKSTVRLAVDRKVFNVDKDISSRGGTGVDVMKNIPGVSVEADGSVTLRNNTPQVYMDGKPTTLTLEQIPADQIDRVEVITNPGAKYEAAAGGGILNVVMKHNSKPGYNGMVTMGVGTNTQYNGMAMLNIKEKKFGFMLMYNINSATNNTTGYSDLTSLNSDGSRRSILNQDIDNRLKRTFQFGRVGLDFFISNRNTLSVSESFVYGTFKTKETQNSLFSDADWNQIYHSDRTNDQNNSFRNFTTAVDFKHTYAKVGKEWALSLQYNRSKGGNDYLYTTNNFTPNNYPIGQNPELERNNGGQHSDMFTAQWDFTHPLEHGLKLEYGLRSNYKLTYSNLTSTDFDYPTNTYIKDTALSNNYKIQDLVNAAYVTLSQEISKFSYQVGLRFEHTYYAGTLLDRGTTYSYQYPSSGNTIAQTLFPSLNLSYKVSDKHEIQLNFARKINRPNFFQISPFVFYSDKNNIRQGNPNLRPEFVNQVEANYNLVLTKFNWLTSLYGRYLQDPIASYSYPKPGTENASPDSLLLISSFINGKNSFSYGWENTFKITAVKNLDITLSGNAFYSTISTNTTQNGTISNSGFSWNGKLILSYKFPQSITAQVNGNYEAPRIIPQGKTLPQYGFDVSLSKDFGIATVNLTVADVLNSRRNGTDIITDDYIQVMSRRRDTRYAKIGVTFKFGKMDSSILRFKKMKKGDGGGMNGGDGLDY